MGRKLLLILVVVALVAGGVGGAYWVATIQVRNTFREAKDLLGKGNVPQAAELFEKVYRKRPASAEGLESLVNLCQLSSSLEQKDKSIAFAKDFMNIAQTDADKARAKYFMGTALLSAGNLPEALAAFEDVASNHASSEIADDALFFLAKVKSQEGKYLDAKQLLQSAIERYPDSNLINQMYQEFGNANIALLFSQIPTPTSIQYTVVSGDTVDGIAKKFKTTPDIIRESNGLSSSAAIRKGNLLKIEKIQFSIVVSKSKNTLTLLNNGELFKIYSVGTGRSNSTPVGDFKITTKMLNPPWYKPGGGLIPFGDKGNLLGTRWLGINCPGYGIHGTWEPDTIGKQSSAGCVRLLNAEVEELFKLVDSGVPVKIID